MKLPASTPWSTPFWVSVQRRQLQLPWCADCDQAHFPPRPFCPHCWSDNIQWRPSAGRGLIHSFTTVRAYPPSAFQGDLPYVIAVVRLDEGVQLLSNIEVHGQELEIGGTVEVVFREIEDGLLPVFTLVDGTRP